jgi:hypothetical protein
MNGLRKGLVVLAFFATVGSISAQKRPAIFIVGDDCDNGVATKAVEESFKEASTISQRWSEGNERVPNTPELFIKCWNVDGESFVVTSFGFTVSGGHSSSLAPLLRSVPGAILSPR